jgi:hypothetical protein
MNVLTTIERISGGGWIIPTALVCVAKLSSAKWPSPSLMMESLGTWGNTKVREAVLGLELVRVYKTNRFKASRELKKCEANALKTRSDDERIHLFGSSLANVASYLKK